MERVDQRPEWADKQVFSTGEAAQICRVSQQTIIRCFDRGRIRGFRVPGSRYRRIPRAELIRFMESNAIPTDELGGVAARVLVVEGDDALRAEVEDALTAEPGLEVATAVTAYDAGLLTQRFRPNLVLLDGDLPDLDAAKVCRRIRSSPELDGIKIIVMANSAAEGGRLDRTGADAIVRKPLDHAGLRQRINEVLATHKPRRRRRRRV